MAWEATTEVEAAMAVAVAIAPVEVVVLTKAALIQAALLEIWELKPVISLIAVRLWELLLMAVRETAKACSTIVTQRRRNHREY